MVVIDVALSFVFAHSLLWHVSHEPAIQNLKAADITKIHSRFLYLSFEHFMGFMDDISYVFGPICKEWSSFGSFFNLCLWLVGLSRGWLTWHNRRVFVLNYIDNFWLFYTHM